jgi:lipoate-protein ligase A
MVLKDISFPDPQDNILFDEVLFVLAEKGRMGESLRFWEAQSPFVVLGRICKEEEDLNLEEVRRARIPVLRRSSGGGTVIQAPGCLNFSLVLAKASDPVLNDLHRSYQLILGKVREALKCAGIEADFYPISDLAVGPEKRKISGNAQRRGKHYILHHGTILYGFDISLAEKFLTIPKQVPEYRRSRPHRAFLANVPLQPEQIKQGFREVFEIQETQSSPSDQEMECLEDLFH